MSDADTQQGQPPAGWSWAHFKAISLETGQWIWGTAQGGFNEKQTTSQVIVDAVIGCIPLLGDATAVRDLIAISIGLSEDEKKRNDTWQWVLLFVLLLALIPVLGGVLKGVGRLLVKLAEDIRLLTGVARAAKIEEAAKAIIRVLNHFKFIGNSEKWLLQLRFAHYQDQMIWALDRFTERFSGALDAVKNKIGGVLPQSALDRIQALKNTMAWLKSEGRKRVPDVVVKIDNLLREVQGYIRSGGETTSRTVVHEVSTGEHAVTYTEEARVVEEQLPKRSLHGGWEQNPSNPKNMDEIAKYYQHKEGYPNLLWADEDSGRYLSIAAFSGKIVNEDLTNGKKIFRLFGNAGETRGAQVTETYAGGGWWGIGEPPATLEEWRGPCAVLDEFNRDGFIVTATIPSGQTIKAATGTVSEQFGQKIPGQYLRGGAKQGVLQLDKELKDALSGIGDKLKRGEAVEPYTDPRTGIIFEFKKTPWTEDAANGHFGYGDVPSPGEVAVDPLAEREIADKKYKDNAK